jgi:glyoxylase-like metal-dependent hydrolase (beta-lactamase superfamily II)
MALFGGGSMIHPVAMVDGPDGITLIDAGLPGQLDAIRGRLSAAGFALSAVKRILLTDQDIDHIGSAEAIVEATGARVYAHVADRPFIEGKARLLKFDPGRWEQRLEALPAGQRERARELLSSPPRVGVDVPLSGWEELNVHGGILVIPTPGHTPGHVCYYLRATRLLIAGDALRVENGELVGPSPGATADMPRALASLRNLLEYEVSGVLCYHGGFSDRNVSGRLRDLVEETHHAA